MFVSVLLHIVSFASSAATAAMLTRGLLGIHHKAWNERGGGGSFPVPKTGGIVILPSMIVGVVVVIALRLVFGSADDAVRTSSFILAAGLLLVYALATIEDIMDTSRWQRQIIVLVACAAMPVIGLYVNDLHGFFGIHHVGWPAGFVITFAYTFLTVKGLEALNSVDGLMPATCLLALAVFGIVFCSMGQDIYSTAAFALAGAVAVFLRYNLFGNEETGDKIRTGHAGVLVIGFCIAYLTMKYAMDNRNVISAHADAVLLPYSLLVFPVFEYVRVWFLGSWRGLRSGEYRKLQIQYVILGKGFSAAQTVGIIILGQLIILTLNLLLHHLFNLNITWIVFLNVAIYVELLRTASDRIEVPGPKIVFMPDDFKDYKGQEGLVSIIMPTYNSSQFVAESIESIQAQTYRNWELIITDDCSTDGTMEIVEGYAGKDSRIVVQRNETNGGAGVSRNRCITAARGQYIAFCDSDDRWLPKKLSLQLSFMRSKGAALCFSPYYTCDENSQYLGYISAPAHVSLFEMMCDNKMGFLTCIYDTAVLGKHLMPKQRKRQDHAMLLGLLRQCRYAYSVPRALAFYRIHPGNMSRSKISLLKYNAQTYTEVFGWPKPLSYAFLFVFFLPAYFAKRLKNIVINAVRSA